MNRIKTNNQIYSLIAGIVGGAIYIFALTFPLVGIFGKYSTTGMLLGYFYLSWVPALLFVVFSFISSKIHFSNEDKIRLNGLFLFLLGNMVAIGALVIFGKAEWEIFFKTFAILIIPAYAPAIVFFIPTSVLASFIGTRGIKNNRRSAIIRLSLLLMYLQMMGYATTI